MGYVSIVLGQVRLAKPPLLLTKGFSMGLINAEEEFLTRRLNNEGAKLLEEFLLSKAESVGLAIEKNVDGHNLFPDALIALFIKDGVAHVEEKLQVKIGEG